MHAMMPALLGSSIMIATSRWCDWAPGMARSAAISAGGCVVQAGDPAARGRAGCVGPMVPHKLPKASATNQPPPQPCARCRGQAVSRQMRPDNKHRLGAPNTHLEITRRLGPETAPSVTVLNTPIGLTITFGEAFKSPPEREVSRRFSEDLRLMIKD